MTSTDGTFTDCGNGNYSIAVTCTGQDCWTLQLVPGMTCTNGSTSMHCTNGVSCNPPNSSLTSSFSIQATDDSLSQTQHLNLSGQTFTLTGVGTNFSYVNTTSNSTTSSPAVRSRASVRISKLAFSV